MNWRILKYIIVIEFLLFVNFIDSFEYKAIGQKGVLYNQLINSAELSICRKEYDSALIHYNKAFSTLRGWSTDYYNATLCALKIDNKQIVHSFIDSLSSRGYSFSRIRKLLPNEFVKDSIYIKSLKERRCVDSIRFNEQNKSFISTLDSMFTLDQKLAYSKSDSLKIEYAKVVYSNGLNLIKWIEQGRFPKDYIYNVGKVTASQVPIVLISHYFALINLINQNIDPHYKHIYYQSLDFTKYDLRLILIKAIKDGIVPPQILTSTINAWSSVRGSHPYCDSDVQIFNNTYTFVKRVSQDCVNQINNNRVELGIGTLEENRLKIKNNETVYGNEFIFNTVSAVSYFNMSDTNLEKMVESYSKLIDWYQL